MFVRGLRAHPNELSMTKSSDRGFFFDPDKFMRAQTLFLPELESGCQMGRRRVEIIE